MPMTANIIHTAKQMVNATVLITSTDSDCCDRETMSASVRCGDVNPLSRHRSQLMENPPNRNRTKSISERHFNCAPIQIA
jgi:hypothetical protein